MECPRCHKKIPDNSVFCPLCGSLARNDMEPEQQVRAVPKVKGESSKKSSKNNSNNYEKEVRRRKMLVWGLIGLFIILFAVDSIFFSKDSIVGDNTTDSATETTGLDELVIFKRTLQDHGLMSDEAIAAYALHVGGGTSTGVERIAGVTWNNNTNHHTAFFKVYSLERKEGGQWTIVGDPKKEFFNDAEINFNQKSLLADNSLVPQSIDIEGKHYFLFAYLLTPQGESNANRSVTIGLLNVDTREMKLFNFEGSTRERGGKELIYSRPLSDNRSAEARYVQEVAQRIGIIYIPTAEELEAERAALEEAALNEPDRADDKWSADNEDAMESLSLGDEVKMKPKTYDEPIFNIKEAKRTINNSLYTVVLDNSGKVYGFNKSTRKYFVVYGKPAASDIGFASGDNNETTLNIKTESGRVIYDLSTDVMRYE